MTAIALAARQIRAGYGGREVLASVDLAVNKGEVFSLLGHNGAGKSTLLKVLFGLHPALSGTIVLDGNAVHPTPAAMASAGVGYLPEGRGVFPNLTVRETFRLALWSASLKGEEAQSRIDEVLSILPRIREFWTRRAGTLSGGQQQMVSIGRVLLSRPSTLIMDEPSIGLAPKLLQDLLAPVRELQLQRGMSILLVEQNLDEAFAISDRVAVMRSGEIVFRGVPADFADLGAMMKYF